MFLKLILWLLVVLPGSVIGMFLYLAIPIFQEGLIFMGKSFNYLPSFGLINFEGLDRI